MEVKEKKYIDPIYLHLKYNVKHGMTKHLSLRKMEYFDLKTNCVYLI